MGRSSMFRVGSTSSLAEGDPSRDEARGRFDRRDVAGPIRLAPSRAFPIAHRAARIGRADGARDDAGGAPRGSARTVAVACIIGPSSAREPCADARSSPRALDPLRLDDARDGVPKRWRSASAREAARGGGRSGRGRRASRESVQAREPTAAVSCERAVPLVSRGVSLRNRVTQRLRISAHAPGHVPRAATVDFSGSTTPPNLITPAKRVSGSNRRVPGLKTPWRLQGLGVCTGTQNSDNIRKNLARGHSAQANLLRERLSSLFTHTRL